MTDIDKMMRVFLLNSMYGMSVDEEQLEKLKNAIKEHYGNLVFDYYVDTDSIRDEGSDNNA